MGECVLPRKRAQATGGHGSQDTPRGLGGVSAFPKCSSRPPCAGGKTEAQRHLPGAAKPRPRPLSQAEPH